MTAPRLTKERIAELRNYADVYPDRQLAEVLDAYEALAAEADRYRTGAERARDELEPFHDNCNAAVLLAFRHLQAALSADHTKETK